MSAKSFRSEPTSGSSHRGVSPPFRAVAVGVLLASGAAGCNTLDAPGPQGSVVVIPTDTRPATLPGEPPAPISGGTLAISADGAFAVAADPDRDRVSLVELDTQKVRHIMLERGDQPGRVQLDEAGRAFVVLRRAGALAVINLEQGALEQRVSVCAAPRGVAVDHAKSTLHVTCAEGRLVSLTLKSAAADGSLSLETTRDLHIEDDLRDVLVRGNQLWVSTFKRAELLALDPNGRVLQRMAAQPFAADTFAGGPSVDGAAKTPSQMQPHLAYRSALDPAGGLVMLHQGASTAQVAIAPDPNAGGATPYGATSGCGGIVSPAITRVSAAGTVQTVPIASGLLSIDLAIAPDDGSLAIVQAGALDRSAPQRQTIFDSSSDSAPLAFPVPSARVAPPVSTGAVGADTPLTTVTLVGADDPALGCFPGRSLTIPGQSTAVAFRRASGTQVTASGPGSWVVQTREPAALTLVNRSTAGLNGVATTIALGGDSVRDTGHDIFHQDAGGGIACASCHPEGAEDGHVWHFEKLGARRTQALHVGLEGTAPFHWGGDQPDISHLMTDVFIGRMGGVHQSDERLSALTRFLFSLQPPAAPVVADEPAVERGRQLFESAEVGCAGCHSGAKLTDNRSIDVGTGGKLQVPSLRGIAYRAPFMHDGCALTLKGRFEPGCGGTAHGNVRGLSTDSIDDLVAYLRTL